jgi:ATP-dependent DNA helicase RecG
MFVKEEGKITNKDYMALLNVSRITATRDLKELVEKDLLISSSVKGAGAFYELSSGYTGLATELQRS